MKINCIHCGHSFPLSDAYDDFEGPVKCPTCRGMLEIKAQDATLKMVRPYSFAQMAPAAPAATTFVIGGTPNQQLQMQQMQQQAEVSQQARYGNIPMPQTQQPEQVQQPAATLTTSYPDPHVIGTVDGTQSGGASPRVAA